MKFNLNYASLFGAEIYYFESDHKYLNSQSNIILEISPISLNLTKNT
jgi:hypothetical protein